MRFHRSCLVCVMAGHAAVSFNGFVGSVPAKKNFFRERCARGGMWDDAKGAATAVDHKVRKAIDMLRRLWWWTRSNSRGDVDGLQTVDRKSGPLLGSMRRDATSRGNWVEMARFYAFLKLCRKSGGDKKWRVGITWWLPTRKKSLFNPTDLGIHKIWNSDQSKSPKPWATVK